MKHVWRIAILSVLAFGVYEAYSDGWIKKSDYHNELLHLLLEALK
jgi:hypothetical protein